MAKASNKAVPRQYQPIQRMRKTINRDGHRFGLLVVVECLGRYNLRTYYRCRCDCGAFTEASIAHLKDGRVTSCGCKQGLHLTTHGLSGLPEYSIWTHIKERCLNPRSKAYPSYGGRGIGICPEWANDFAQFFADMGGRPDPSMSVERSDNSKGYELGNCKWATALEQSRNKRTSRKVTIDGATKTLSEWASESGICSATLAYRLRVGRADLFGPKLRGKGTGKKKQTA